MIKKLLLLLIILCLILIPSLVLAVCSERDGGSGDLICEDWDSDTPPTTPWPCEDGPTWHGWKPAVYGGGQCGEIQSTYVHSGTKALQIHKQLGIKSTVDIEHTISGAPSVAYMRFYVYFPEGYFDSGCTWSHFMFMNSASRAECCLDLKSRACTGGNVGAYFNFHTYEPDGSGTDLQSGWNQETPCSNAFDLSEHEGEWILVEWKADWLNELASLWINEQPHLTDFDAVSIQYDGAFSAILSGYSLYTTDECNPIIDDLVVSTSYIGPRLTEGAPTVSTATIANNGQTVTIVFSEAVTFGGGYGTDDLVLNCTVTGDDIDLLSPSGSGTTWELTASERILASSIESCTIDYNGETGDIVDGDTTDMEDCTDCATVTNDSDQGYIQNVFH